MRGRTYPPPNGGRIRLATAGPLDRLRLGEEVGDFAPRSGGSLGAGLDKPLAMVCGDMGAAEITDDFRARRARGDDAGDRDPRSPTRSRARPPSFPRRRRRCRATVCRARRTVRCRYGLEEAEKSSALEAEMDALGRGGRGDAARPLEPLEEFENPRRGLELLGEQLFRPRPKLSPELRRRDALDRLLDNGEYIGPGLADALSPDFLRQGGAELGEQALVGAHRQDLAVDEHAVAIEDEEIEPLGKSHISVTPWLASGFARSGDAAPVGRPPILRAPRSASLLADDIVGSAPYIRHSRLQEAFGEARHEA